ncbi:AtpZ/AtpI family protein [Salisediminibacterium selenitireducens]|uniref:AtpZ/AtpI family protein n=1 Tax=Bacillus selenitireducens (strain ATCC 700615 / DSM 15326 / MLS10) TaxID=439292 RepID=D6Y0S4_BACIE|nr:AtpZ/AtpI family protein [Salisediminibacterium selenitireducens]ADI00642.1 hypothetical protein Bsel_3160 [[Bacillus] selenitireducens MLS10]
MAQEPRHRQLVRSFALMSTISAYFIGPVLLGVFVGRWLDERYDGSGLFIAGGMLVGLTTGVIGIFRVIRQFYGDEDDAQ